MILNKLTKLYAVYLFLRSTFAANQCPDIKAYWWESRPYVYKNDTAVTGVLPNIFMEAAKYCCKSKLMIDWSGGIGSYQQAWMDLEQNFNKEPKGLSLEIWLPFSLLTNISENITALKIVESNQMVLFVSENKWDKLNSVYNGFKRIAPQVLATLLLTILFGILIWIVETTSNSQFPKPFPRGAWHGFWWAAVTITTVGYGDKAPRTCAGRLIGIIWMITGLILFPVLTAEVTSILTDNSYSLVSKKAGALKNSHEIKHAIDYGANAYECNSYSHCLDMLRNEVIEVMLVDVHAASWLQKSEKEKNTHLVKKGQMALKIPINAFARKKDEGRLKDLFSCISQNSSLVTSTLRKAHNDFEVSNSKGAIFSEGMKQFSYILAGIVFGIYCIVFAVDFFIRYKTKKNKIGDFRQGVFMEKVVIKNGSQQEMREIEDHKEVVMRIIQQQRAQLADIQESLNELERRIAS